MTTQRYELRNRYIFTGKLVMLTAFHIGGGRATLSSSDSPVVLTPEQLPFIPGSSFKGALRSTIEKLVPSLPSEAKLSSCGLIEPLDGEEKPKSDKPLCPTVRQRDITQERRERPGDAEKIREQVLKELCNTCQLFGSPFAAARVNIGDLYMSSREWNGAVQIRDGVAIDRDSEKAKDRLKYDFEVVPASATFDLTITLENATSEDLQLLCMGLSEFVHGFGFIGGKRSRGLGACRLDDLAIRSLRLDEKDLDKKVRTERLKNYLLRGEASLEPEDREKFLDRHITAIFDHTAALR
ncbi:CRISPR-associated RAMP protein [Reticulibacter mediterranei]|uniref:CRISPR-associated RAMP protein n=1 Tax=Reticulibacter mediterranei TaxID=2778369 RepID=A0A8J3IGY2_9CHLR|nr:CRISPR-associated RAMP protein Csx7 [Reticulibacter mediterranei]GHO95309.1 CRISPR-associated RAMP protein [Reticulibacter mediterranei]